MTVPRDARSQSETNGCPPQIEAAILLNRLSGALELEARNRPRRNNRRGPDFVSLQMLFEEICRQPIPIPAAQRSIAADVAAATHRASQNLGPTIEASVSMTESSASTGPRDGSRVAKERGAWRSSPQKSGEFPRRMAGGNGTTRAAMSYRLREAKRTEGRNRMEEVVESAADARAHVVKLRERREIAENTFAFLFDKPDGFTFKAGQFIELSLNQPHAIDARGKTRRFSLASAPSENLLMVTTRVRDSALKRALKTSPLGTEVEIEGPSVNRRFTRITPPRRSSSPAESESPPSAARCWTPSPRGSRTASSCSIPTADPRTHHSLTSCRPSSAHTGTSP